MISMTDHRVLEAMRAAHAALDLLTVRDRAGQPVGWVPMGDMSPVELAEAVRLQAALEGRVTGLRLATVAAADAGGAAEDAAAADTMAWAATAGRNRARSWGGVWLAQLLEVKYPHTRAALAAGRISEEHAAIIVRAAEKVPDAVTAEELTVCEEQLVDKAERMAPKNLRRAAKRLLEPLSTTLADRHEGDLLAAEERRAERETWLWLEDNGDGTWTGRFTIPQLHGHLLQTVLGRLSGPRRYSRTRSGEPVEDPTLPGAGAQLSHTEALGAAFLELLEHLPETGHTRSAITLVVHVQDAQLRADLDAAAVLETGARISSGEVRRLACQAGILPMVLNGRSVPVDLGTSQRLFTRAQAVALSATHHTCAAAGCDRPFAWCELHHRIPFGAGGPTDLANAAPLCGYHHRRVHDGHYHHQWLPDGTVEFRHRWPSHRTKDPWTNTNTEAITAA